MDNVCGHLHVLYRRKVLWLEHFFWDSSTSVPCNPLKDFLNDFGQNASRHLRLSIKPKAYEDNEDAHWRFLVV